MPAVPAGMPRLAMRTYMVSIRYPSYKPGNAFAEISGSLCRDAPADNSLRTRVVIQRSCGRMRASAPTKEKADSSPLFSIVHFAFSILSTVR